MVILICIAYLECLHRFYCHATILEKVSTLHPPWLITIPCFPSMLSSPKISLSPHKSCPPVHASAVCSCWPLLLALLALLCHLRVVHLDFFIKPLWFCFLSCWKEFCAQLPTEYAETGTGFSCFCDGQLLLLLLRTARLGAHQMMPATVAKTWGIVAKCGGNAPGKVFLQIKRQKERAKLNLTRDAPAFVAKHLQIECLDGRIASEFWTRHLWMIDFGLLDVIGFSLIHISFDSSGQ